MAHTIHARLTTVAMAFFTALSFACASLFSLSSFSFKNYYGDSNETIPTGATTHRGTFAQAAPHWKAWFDQP
ncbi:MAG: hypothetical protein AB7E12_05755 [Burkholderiaceae bacterium]